MSKTFDEIRERAYKAGIPLYKVCELAGINRMTLVKWRKKEPQTLVYLERINQVLTEAENKNNDKP